VSTQQQPKRQLLRSRTQEPQLWEPTNKKVANFV
jgi:hypothetical protein